jgi:hypothetical protein
MNTAMTTQVEPILPLIGHAVTVTHYRGSRSLNT